MLLRNVTAEQNRSVELALTGRGQDAARCRGDDGVPDGEWSSSAHGWDELGTVPFRVDDNDVLARMG